MSRTALIAALLALPASVAFYFWATTDTRLAESAVTRSAQLALYRTALEAAHGATGIAAVEAQGTLSRLTLPSGYTAVAGRALVHVVGTVDGVPVVTRDDGPMRFADEDQWLLREGYVSQRALERRLVTILLATYNQPDLCPSGIRASNIAPPLASSLIANTAPLEPLCRRDRQLRLAEVALGKPLPFSAGLFLRPADRTLAGSGKAATLVQGAQTADDLWDPKALGEAIPVLLAQMAYEDALIAKARKLSPSPTLAAVAKRLNADTDEACALSVALQHSLDPKRLVAELVNAYTEEHWPPEPRRSSALALLYALSEVDVPKEGAANAEHLRVLLDVKPKPLCIYDAPPITKAISREILQHFTDSLDRTHYIR